MERDTRTRGPFDPLNASDLELSQHRLWRPQLAQALTPAFHFEAAR